MIILIGGASHTGKTNLSQILLEKYGYPYLSIDHLKMGLIRSGYGNMTAEDDDKIVSATWPIIAEIIKTAVENSQNLIIEGYYIPYNWKKSFEPEYLDKIRHIYLVMTGDYIEKQYNDIKKFGSIIEKRGYDNCCDKSSLIKENDLVLQCAKEHGCNYILIDKNYNIDDIIAAIGIE